jgi:hypothetical protein
VRRTGKLYPAPAFDHLVLALPPEALGQLVEMGPPEQTLANVMPQLRHAGERLPSEPIAVMDLYFKIKLDGIPRENIAVTDSDNYFSIIDLSELWPGPRQLGVTALTLAASDYWALPSDDDRVNAHVMIQELHPASTGATPTPTSTGSVRPTTRTRTMSSSSTRWAAGRTGRKRTPAR